MVWAKELGALGIMVVELHPTNDMCLIEIKNVELEEVGRLEYFINHSDVNYDTENGTK
ncbi:hypothetical protein KHA80_05545 [Anaerobacillus sp. HL2]|nr:hypothetical protein KHA80_05545 [Anaerobacillus sp. HL2]